MATHLENASGAEPGARSFFRESWLIVAIELLLIVGGFVVLWPSAAALVAEWENTDNTTYTHGFLIAAICLWLLFRRHAELRSSPAGFNGAAAIALGVASIVWLIAVRAGLQIVHLSLLPVLLWFAVYAALGVRVAFISAFALGYLVFAIPVWGLGNEVLQTLTVKAVDAMLRTTGVTAYVDGNIVHLASGTFEVAGGCSGLHFFIVGVALAALYGEVNHDTRKMRLQILALAAALAMLTNWVRVYSIILAGYLTDMQHYLVRVDHYKFGWVVFAVMMVIFFAIVRRLPPSPAVPQEVRRPLAEKSLLRLSSGAAVSLLVLALGPLWNAFVPVRAAQLTEDSLLPKNPGGWLGPSLDASGEWQPTFVGADRTEQGGYKSSGQPVQMYCAVYASQAQNKELISYQNSILGDSGAQIVSASRIEPRGPVSELIVEDGRGKAVVWHFYRIGSQQTARGSVAQLRYGIASLADTPVSQVVALRARCAADCEVARAALSDFMAAAALGSPSATP